jgi:hypothetical protein
MAKRKPFALRIDAELFAALQRYADDELRSLNAQLEYLLRQSLRDAGRWPAEAAPDAEDPAPGGEAPTD